jgi:hypothetical protein
MDGILCSQLQVVATDIAALPAMERNALLSDLGNRLPTERRKSLELAFREEGLQLHNGAPDSCENDFEHKNLLCQAYGHVIHLLKQFYGKSMKISRVLLH